MARLYTTVADRYAGLVPEHQKIVDLLRPYFLLHPGVSEEIRRDTLQFRFPNAMRCYIMTYKRKHPILGVSRGARMIRQEPALAALFDENKTVVSKIWLRDTQTIFQKALPELIEKIYNLPSGIGVLE